MAEMLPPAVLKKVQRECMDMLDKPVDGIRLTINEQNIADIQAEIDGPAGTPYEGGVFRMRLQVPQDYPQAPPKGFFVTKIFHPNVSTSGEICVNVLKKDWSADMGIKHIFVVVKCLLVDANPESALNEEAGRLLLEDYEEFARHARLMTSIHAHSTKRGGPLTASGGNVSGQAAAAGTSGAEPNKPGGAEGSNSPAPKKAKGDGAAGQASKPASTAAAKVKKSLKRL